MQRREATGDTSEANQSQNVEIAMVEYQCALDQFRHYSSLRRQDMAFVTTAQAVVLTVLGNDTLSFSVRDWLLTVMAVVVLLLGLNSERRLNAYLEACMVRACAIEQEWGMKLSCGSPPVLRKRRALVSNSITFPLYYAFFALAWLVLWVYVLAQ